MSKSTSATATKKPAAKPLSMPKEAKGPTKAQLKKAAALGLMPESEITEEQRVAERRSNAAMSFSVQQLSAPQAPALITPPAVTDKFKEELAALQAKHGIVPSAVKVSTPRAEKIIQHGITRPNPETLCGKIWAAADELSATSHGVATIASLKLHSNTQGVNEHTIKTQYARWRAFNGVTGRLPKIHAVHQVQGEYAALEK